MQTDELTGKGVTIMFKSLKMMSKENDEQTIRDEENNIHPSKNVSFI